MDFGIKDKRALITGAGRGIGESIALNLANEGVKVAIVSRTKCDLENVFKKMGGKEKGHYFIPCNLTEENAPKKVILELNKNFGEIDILINHIGGDLNIRDPLSPIEDWRKLWRINIEIAIELTNQVIPTMQKNKWGRIINTSSTAGMENNGAVTYCTTKAALTAYTRCMGRIFAKDGIVICAVLPGAILTKEGYWEKVLKEKPEHAKKYLDERCPFGKFGEPEDIGTMVTMLCSKQAKFCQGSIIPIDGGQSRHFFWTGDR